jgi:acyl-CoA dehydrogenase
MLSVHSDEVEALLAKLRAFMEEHVHPREDEYRRFVSEPANQWRQPPVVEELKVLARAEGIWNWFLTPEYEPFSPGLHNREYVPLAEVMGRVPWSFEVFNCSAPDRGNMEVLARFGTEEQKDRWLVPLLEGRIRSSFAMTEPGVASSDASNISLRIERAGDQYVLNGRKWYVSGIMHPHNEVLLVMGLSNPDAPMHQRHSTVIVPRDTPGVEVVRTLNVFNSGHTPGGEGELQFTDVRVPVSNIVVGEGQGFAIAQGRLGPGRFQYAMQAVGMAQRCLELMCQRVESRVAFGQRLSEMTSIRQDIARSRCEIEQARLLVLTAAEAMDRLGVKGAMDYIAMVKIVAPRMCQDVSERAMQAFGGAGVCDDTPIPEFFLTSRLMRIADGPDEVHMSQLARRTIRQLT